jgi:hypothetical protein
MQYPYRAFPLFFRGDSPLPLTSGALRFPLHSFRARAFVAMMKQPEVSDRVVKVGGKKDKDSKRCFVV